MPGGDGTGPAGMGPMTGRAAGFCAGYPVPGFMNPIPGGFGGRGFGWGRGRGWGRGFGRGRGRLIHHVVAGLRPQGSVPGVELALVATKRTVTTRSGQRRCPHVPARLFPLESEYPPARCPGAHPNCHTHAEPSKALQSRSCPCKTAAGGISCKGRRGRDRDDNDSDSNRDRQDSGAVSILPILYILVECRCCPADAGHGSGTWASQTSMP